MLYRLALTASMFVSMALSADFAGTWKLNTTKSKYDGIPMPKEMTVTYGPQGAGWRYTGKGAGANGEAINRSFTYAKDGAEIKTTGFAEFDAIVIQNGNTDKSIATYKRQGKAVGTGTRTVSADGKTMTITGEVTLPDGKKTTTVSVYDKH
jgi:hypothetical protein